MRIGQNCGDRSNTFPRIPYAGRVRLDDARLTGPLLFANGATWEEIPLRRLAASAPLRRVDERVFRRRFSRTAKRAAGLSLAGCLVLAAACGALVRPMTDASRGARLETAMQDRTSPALPMPVSPAPVEPSATTEAASAPPPPAREPTPSPRSAYLDARGPSPFEAVAPMRRPRSGAFTDLVAFKSAPFPYDGMIPGRGPFLNAESDGQRGHRTARGILWEDRTFNDNRVLVHVPSSFDPDRPAVMVVFFHGHGATLARDVRQRQQVPEQITASGANAVLVAPQFAVDARDSSAGQFWQAGGFARFLDEAAGRLAAAQGNPGLKERFRRMPIVMVAYSGGYLPAAYCLKDIAATNRVRGVVLLDAVYGELDKYASWLADRPSAFLVSAYTRSTQGRNAELERMLRQRGVASDSALGPDLSRGGGTFIATGAGATHTDYVTQAWTDHPIADVLRRLPEFSLDRAALTASLGTRLAPSASIGEP